jgi:hypothetical protein
MTRVNLLACSIGRSPGFSPRRIFDDGEAGHRVDGERERVAARGDRDRALEGGDRLFG